MQIIRPDLSNSKLIAFDIETLDPNLREMGPGVYRDDGRILGVSIATSDGFAEYYNLGHWGINKTEQDINKRYLADILGTSVPKLGANLMYDTDWLENWLGISIGGALNDVQIAAPLLDEYADSYSLDTLANRYLGKGKSTDLPKKFCLDRGLKGDFRAHLHKMPYELVRTYAIDDAREPLEIFEKQYKEMESQELLPVYNMEVELTRVLLMMRKNGIRIDTKKRDETSCVLKARLDVLENTFMRTRGDININSSKQVARLFDRLGISYPRNTPSDTALSNADMFRTEQLIGSPNIDQEFLSKCPHPLAKEILTIREMRKAIDTFFDGAFLKHDVNGRIHCSFIPLKQDEGGTVTGRLSCRNPNLQQVTSPDRDKARTDEYGKMCRELFIPEEDCILGKIDYSQIEYRTIMHFARGPKSEELREAYRNDPNTDFHSMAQQWVREMTGQELIRVKAKNLGFGSAYFMGPKSMASHFGWTLEDAKSMLETYFNAFPFIVPTRNQVVEVGKLRGYVKTPLGRRARVADHVRKAHKEYIIFNHLIQGTSADILKMGMVKAYKEGVFGEIIPHLTVHDELVLSIPRNKRAVESYKHLKWCMEHSIKLDVPIIADAEHGPNWGTTENTDFDKLREEV